MKVIDLLNKIANKEDVPQKIKWGEHYLTWFVYEHKALDEPGDPNIFECAGGITSTLLNDEIEIIEDTPKEDKKIEKLNIGLIADNELQGLVKSINVCNKEIQDKLNEVIDRLNGEDNDSR